MPRVPESTSAERIEDYAAGTRIAAGVGRAWKDVQLSVRALPPVAEVFSMPTTAEPMIAWTTSGEAEAEECVDNGPWIKSHLKKGSMYLTAAGAPYEFRWKTLSPEPFEVTVVVISLSLFNEALEEVFGKQAANARLKDVSGFQDAQLTALLQPLRDEAFRRSSSRLLVRGLGQAVAVYLARNYTVLESESPSGAPALPNFKLQRVTQWMADHLAEEFNLATLAPKALG